MIYLDGSKMEGKNTAEASWGANNKHLSTHQLGRGTDYGIFKAEFVGFIHVLQLAEQSLGRFTRQITRVLENKGVFKDKATKHPGSNKLTQKREETTLINDIEKLSQSIKNTLRWCPDHKGLGGNEKANSLATAATKKNHS